MLTSWILIGIGAVLAIILFLWVFFDPGALPFLPFASTSYYEKIMKQQRASFGGKVALSFLAIAFLLAAVILAIL